MSFTGNIALAKRIAELEKGGGSGGKTYKNTDGNLVINNTNNTINFSDDLSVNILNYKDLEGKEKTLKDLDDTVNTIKLDYVSESVALRIFLKKTDATATYLTKTDATSKYLTKTDASSTYALKTTLNNKQDKLIAGDNIIIGSDNKISASGVSQSYVDDKISEIKNLLNDKQDKLLETSTINVDTVITKNLKGGNDADEVGKTWLNLNSDTYLSNLLTGKSPYDCVNKNYVDTSLGGVEVEIVFEVAETGLKIVDANDKFSNYKYFYLVGDLISSKGEITFGGETWRMVSGTKWGIGGPYKVGDDPYRVIIKNFKDGESNPRDNYLFLGGDTVSRPSTLRIFGMPK